MDIVWIYMLVKIIDNGGKVTRWTKRLCKYKHEWTLDSNVFI